MKYIYKNVTTFPATVLLASKNQEYVNTLILTPGASKELDYPGLNMYVPNILSCITIDTDVIIPVAQVLALESIESIESVEIEHPAPTITLIDEQLLEPAAGEELELPETPEVPPVADPLIEIVPPPAPSLEIIKTAKAPIKPIVKPKPGKKN
jgi:hypothetical protein